MQQVFLSAQSKSIHAVLVNAIGNILIDMVLVGDGHGADDGAVAHIPAQREGRNGKALARLLFQYHLLHSPLPSRCCPAE